MIIKTKKGKEYEVIEWQLAQLQLVENIQILLSTAKDYIHKVRLDNEQAVYIVPEEVFLMAKNNVNNKQES